MLSFLPASMIGTISLLFYIINTLICCFFLFSMAILKIIIPIPAWRRICTKILDQIATLWIDCNTFNLWLTKNINWDVQGIERLKNDDWYLVVSNHRSWADILVLQKVFNRKIPFLKFFLKKELIWVPILGLAWWALDYPFMKRYSKNFLKKNPHLKGQDIEITKKACLKYKNNPVSVMNFLEGTRFTKGKHNIQKSPFTNLLKPKAGGIAFVLSTMGEQMSSILNVTIIYPKGIKSFWAFISGNVSDVLVHVESIPITEELLGNYETDLAYRANFQKWVNEIWANKDLFIDFTKKNWQENRYLEKHTIAGDLHLVTK